MRVQPRAKRRRRFFAGPPEPPLLSDDDMEEGCFLFSFVPDWLFPRPRLEGENAGCSPIEEKLFFGSGILRRMRPHSMCSV
mmetsp:Transcript_3398/g.4747  ORF Transcript_3398/g.4747 Transcript_3398/m.4747 type:complete len:81 (+) Transcript_3398:205-447(+)